MKKKLGRIAAVLLIAACAVAGIAALSKVLRRGNAETKFSAFMSEKNDFDVFYMGASRVYNAIFPMELWKDYGIVSYNCALNSNTQAMSYHLLQMAFNVKTPKLVVIDAYATGKVEKADADSMLFHDGADAFPLSKAKVKAAFDLYSKGDAFGYIFDFLLYHGRWDELTEDDFTQSASTEKGANSRIGAAVLNEPATGDDGVEISDDTAGAKYLRMTIEDCKRRGIDVLLIYLPQKVYNPLRPREIRYAMKLSAEYGVPFIDFEELSSSLLNDDTDWRDANHLNTSGARKLTDYLGKYISENYSFADHRTEEAYASWNADYEAYEAFKENNFAIEPDLDSYLTLLADKNYSFVMYTQKAEIFSADSRMNALLDNAALKEDGSVLSESARGTAFVISDSAGGKVLSGADGFSGEDCSFGAVSAGIDSDGNPFLKIGDGENLIKKTVTDTGTGTYYTDVYITVIDNATGEAVETARFDANQTAGTRINRDTAE